MDIVETGDVAAEDVRQRLCKIMDKTGEKAKTASRIKTLTPEQTIKTLAKVKERFFENIPRHEGMKWEEIEARLRATPKKIWSLHEMERTQGEPDVVGYDSEKDKFLFFDCSAESPLGRRFCAYDRKAEELFRKRCPKSKCDGNAVYMAKTMGLRLPDKEFYRKFNEKGEFDMRSQNWLLTKAITRNQGYAISAQHAGFYAESFFNTIRADNPVNYIGFRGILEV